MYPSLIGGAKIQIKLNTIIVWGLPPTYIKDKYIKFGFHLYAHILELLRETLDERKNKNDS